MKRFLLFVVIAVTVVTLGLTIWRFSINNEVIILHNPEGKVINVGEKISVADILDIKNQSQYTTINYESSNPDILVYDESREGFYAQQVGGETEIVVTTSNKNYSKLTMTVTIRDGSQAYPFQIASAQELAMIGSPDSVYGLDDYYELVDDIYVGNLGVNYRWTPIGYGSDGNGEFNGHFNGNGHVIYNVYITDTYAQPEADKTETPAEQQEEPAAETTETPAETPAEETQASESNVNAAPAEVAEPVSAEEEAAVVEPVISGEGYNANYSTSTFANGAGFFYAIGPNGVVENLTLSKVNIEGSFLNVGALAAVNRGTIKTVDIYDLAKSDIVSNSRNDSYVGGIVGVNEGTIYWSSSDVALISNLDLNENMNAALYAGGIAGRNMGSIYECYYKGAMTRNGSKSTFGGIVGINDCNTDGTDVVISTINDCYAVIDEYATSAVVNGGTFGGIVGKNNNFSSDSSNVVSGCYFGLTEAKSSSLDKPEKYIAKNIVDGEQVEIAVSNLKSLKDLTQSDTFIRVKYATGEKEYWSWNVWQFTTRNDGHPVINKNNTIKSNFSQEVSIDKETSLTISSAEEFISALNNPNGTYKITNDIDFSTYTAGYKNYKDGYWYPIETFSGTIYSEGVDTDGDGIIDRDFAIISNLKIYNSKSNSNLGIFKTWTKGAIENVMFDNVTFLGEKVGSGNVGVLAGVGSEVEVKNVTIRNVSYAIQGVAANFGTIFGKYGAQGSSNIFGQIEGVEVENVEAKDLCYFVNAGGLVGYNYKTITAIKNGESIIKNNTVSNVNIKAKHFGGVAGQNFKVIERTTVSNINHTINYSVSPDLYLDRYFVEAGRISIAAGGIVACDRDGSTVQYCEVKDSTFTIHRAYFDSSAVTYLGGAAGISRSAINNVQVVNTTLNITADAKYETKAANTPAVGGIVGIAEAGSVINNVRFEETSSIDTPITRDGYSYVGGIAGIASNASYFKLTESRGDITGFYAGGLAGVAGTGSTFTRSAVSQGNIRGAYTAGLACLVKIDSGATGIAFDNCYSNATLTLDGNGTNAKAAGFVFMFVTIQNDGSYTETDPSTVVLNSCYSAVNYSGNGTKYAITSWDGKFKFNLWFIHIDRTYKHIMNSNCFYENRSGLDNKDDETQIKSASKRSKALTSSNFNTAFWNIEVKDGGLSLRYITINL